jgi:anhydro-N-acetylmuramic acid kinase
MKKTFHVIGLMSGTSLDGLDIAYCELHMINKNWEFDILEAETVNYTQVWIQILQEAPTLDGLSLALLHTSYGHWIGQTTKQFITKHNIQPDLIASHGHTIFHRPADKMTLQIGSGAAIAAETGITTVSDFRSLNVALGGQGAPLVPIGDRLLFSDFDACVNIGGFANISMESGQSRKAWDICPVNIVINNLTNRIGLPFDASGEIARSGSPDKVLLKALDALPYYKMEAPKSLGKEWVEHNIYPLLDNRNISHQDLICTFTHHAAQQISSNLPRAVNEKVIFTGGGTHNTYLISLIRDMASCSVVVPDDKVVDFKEALIFALLGTLRLQNMTNCLSSATGAVKDCSSGAIHYQPKRLS